MDENGQHNLKKKRKFNCNYCEKTFCTFVDLRTHIDVHKIKKTKILNSNLRLNNTEKNLVKKPNFYEPIIEINPKTNLDEIFDDKISEKDSYDNGRPFKNHKCEFCLKEFKQYNNLLQHLEKLHKNQKKTYKCDLTQDKPFKCNQCLKQFAQYGYLQQHLKKHDGKSLEVKSNGSSQQKLYKCTECDKEFTQSSNLNTHLKLHRGLKPFKCEFCSKEFTQAGNLHAHIKIHVGDKLFNCEFCPETFSIVSSLKKHIKSLHPKMQMSKGKGIIKIDEKHDEEETNDESENIELEINPFDFLFKL